MAHENPNWKLSRVASTGAVFVYAAGSTSDITDDMLYDDVLSGDEKNAMTGTTDNATEGEIETTPEDVVQSIEVDEYDIVCTKDEEGNLPLHGGVTLWGDEGTFPQLPFPPAVGRSHLDDPSVETIDTPMGDGEIEESNFGIMNSASSRTDWPTFWEQLVNEGQRDEGDTATVPNKEMDDCGVSDMESITVGSSVFETTDDESEGPLHNPITASQHGSSTTDGMGSPDDYVYHDEEYNNFDSSAPDLESPCRRARPMAMRHTSSPRRVSRHFKKKNVSPKNIPRPAWLKTNASNRRVAQKPVPRPKKPRPATQRTDSGTSENSRTLEELGKLERSPRHRWTSDQRIFLCVLNRWYCRSPVEFGAIFNRHYGLDLPVRKVIDQFESYIRLHGRHAFKEYDDVFYRTPFDDPEGIYHNIRTVIEREACSLGLILRRRDKDDVSPDGQAARAKSENTRKINRQLRLKLKASQRLIRTKPPRNDDDAQRGREIRANASDEAIVDVEEESAPSPSVSTHSNTNEPPSDVGTYGAETQTTPFPSLAFRVWSDASGTPYDEDRGFWASLFASQKAPSNSPAPLPQNDSYGLFTALANSHLSIKARGHSAFVSVASSLLQVLNYAARMQAESPSNPVRLALINLDALNKATLHRGSQVIADLKRTGQLSFRTKYQALHDIMVWRHIPRSAVISATLVSDVEDIAGELLRLDVFGRNLRTPTVAKRLRSMGRAMDAETAESLGLLGKLVGLRSTRVSLGHIGEFVACVVDGWSIRGEVDTDVAFTFARTLDHRTLTMRDVMSAFAEGFRHGNKNLVRFHKD